MLKLKSLKWNFEKDLEIYMRDLKVLEELLREVESLKDYDGKGVNGWFEKRIKKINEDLYIKEKFEWQSNDDFVIELAGNYYFETAHGNEYGDNTIMLYFDSPEGLFDYESFKAKLEKVVAQRRDHIAELEAIDIEAAHEEYKAIYQMVCDYKEKYEPIKRYFERFRKFY